MKTADLDQIQFVTRHFNGLKGLRIRVPLGLVTLGAGVTTAFHTWPISLLFMVVVPLALFLETRSPAYYRTTFGEAEHRPSLAEPALSVFSPAGPAAGAEDSRKSLDPSTRPILTFIGLGFIPLVPFASVWAILWVGRPVLAIDHPTDWSHLVPQTVMMYFLFGALFLGTWLWRGHRLSQGHYLILGFLLLGLASLGVALGFGLPTLWDLGIARFFPPALGRVQVAWIVCGASLALAGLLDHWQLVRVLGQPIEENQP
jgi:hypothetical protein